jgi:hypothetical protein
MTSEEILAEISSDPELSALLPDTEAIAAAMSEVRTKPAPFEAGKGEVLNSLGLTVGNAFCDYVDLTPDLRHVKQLLEAGRLRLDTPTTIDMVNGMVDVEISRGVFFSQENADTLLALAHVPDPVSEFDVRCAIYADDGSRRI